MIAAGILGALLGLAIGGKIDAKQAAANVETPESDS